MSSPTDLPGVPDEPEVPTPVTLDRVLGHIDAQAYDVDREHQRISRRWSELEITVALSTGEGSALVIRGTRLGEPIPLERTGDVVAFVNDWHRERIWPVIVLARGEDQLQVHAHLGVDVGAGLTQAQLRESLRLGVGTIRQCFQALAQAPGLATGPSADPETG